MILYKFENIMFCAYLFSSLLLETLVLLSLLSAQRAQSSLFSSIIRFTILLWHLAHETHLCTCTCMHVLVHDYLTHIIRSGNLGITTEMSFSLKNSF